MAGKFVCRDTALSIDDSTGACKSFYGLGNHCALAYTTEAPNVTCFGDLVQQRLPDGLKNWELTFDAHFGSTDVTDADAVLSSVVGGATRFCLGPTGSETGVLKYTACGVLTDYRLSFKPDGVGVISGTMVARSGSLTRTNWSWSGSASVILIAGTQPPGEFYRSVDSGQTWTLVPSDAAAAYSLALVSGIGDTAILVAGTILTPPSYGTVYRSVDGGQTWTLAQQLGDEANVFSLALVSGTGDTAILVAGTYPTSEIYRSIDGGQTWTLTQQLGDETEVYSLALVSGTGNTAILVAGTGETGEVYRSTDGGQTWTLMQRLGSEIAVYGLTLVSGTGDTAILVAGTAITGKIYRSTDGGQTWTLMQRLGDEINVLSVALVSGTGDTAILVAGTYPTGEIYRSTDGGQTWTLMQRLGNDDAVHSLVLVWGMGDTAILVAGTGLNDDTKGKVYRSTDGGQTWTLIQQLGNVSDALSLVRAGG